MSGLGPQALQISKVVKWCPQQLGVRQIIGKSGT